RDMIDAAHAIAARLLKRLVRGFNGHPRILAGPPAVRTYRCATPAPSPTDSS
ncbi:MAG: hypothetical protein JNJ73_10825, partial [Hyphomonadaceae bacterium]|nr:hypothetical protein [Hyphomonadaceae bacterium]